MELFKLWGEIGVKNADANKAIDETTDKAEKGHGKISSAFGKIGSAAVSMGKVIASGIGVASAGIIAITKSASDAYANYEQLVGGVETLFAESADTVIQNAANAYMTAGMSANEYMETVTSFSASLLQSLGGDTVEAAKKADTAITDMSDNANKMGTSMESIQNAYQGFAKQNYTMLDNLKLGYGGTKEEMERLLADAEAISGIHYDISSYADVVDAIHVVQTEIGITGTTAKEAGSTIQGSLGSVRGAWQNLLVGLADDNQDFEKLLDNFINSAVGSVQNLLPRIQIILQSIPKLIQGLMPQIPPLIQSILPALIESAVYLVNGVVAALPAILDALITIIPVLLQGLQTIASALISAMPEIISLIVLFLTDENNIQMILESAILLFTAIVSAVPEIAKNLLKAAPDIIKGLIQGLFNAVPTLLKSLKDILKSFLQAFKDFFGISSPSKEMAKQGGFIVDGLINGIKNLPEKARQIFQDLKNKISNMLDNIKGLFHFSWSLPHLPLPHFSIRPRGWSIGDLLDGEIPHLSIDWYAKAMNSPLLLDKPTIFGASGNQLLGGGEAGMEVVSGANTLMGMIQSAVNRNDETESLLRQVLEFLKVYIPDIAQEKNIILDNGTLVGQLAPAMDISLGNISRLKERGR